MDQKKSEKSGKELLYNGKYAKDGKTFKWMAFIFAIFLIVIGSMLVYESSQNPAFDTAQNTNLIAVGAVAIVLSAAMLVAMVYVENRYPRIAIKFFYIIVVMIMFGTSVGTVAIINGVDVPNLGGRATLGWVLGGITTGLGVLTTLLTAFALLVVYSTTVRNHKFSQWFVVDKGPQKGLILDEDVYG